MATETCPRCKGRKKVECGYCGNNSSRKLNCQGCHGKGLLICPTCKGYGWVQRLGPGSRP